MNDHGKKNDTEIARMTARAEEEGTASSAGQQVRQTPGTPSGQPAAGKDEGTGAAAGPLRYGFQERVIGRQIGAELETVPQKRKSISPIRKAEDAAEVLTGYLSGVLRKALKGLRIESQAELVNEILETVRRRTMDDSLAGMTLDGRPGVLRALLREQDWRLACRQTADSLTKPETSLARCSLFTAGEDVPRLVEELRKEIATADRVDLMVSFIRLSGVNLLKKELEDFTGHGGRLRVLTTTYMGATGTKAIETLARLPGTEVRISYDGSESRLHAKVYIFHRDNGFSTAYVGSSNLSKAALRDGMEWNVKISRQDQPDLFKKIKTTYDGAWDSRDFEAYADTESDRIRLQTALRQEKSNGKNAPLPFADFEIRPKDFQQDILDRLDAERSQGRFRNLVVAATGTGKTVVSAFDYKRWREARPQGPCRLLFVAHREEILRQSLATFQGVLRDQNFGCLRTGSEMSEDVDHLFLTIQSFSQVENLPPDYYQFIIVDEFHHAAALSYRKLLSFFQPEILLGLTATPERLDGQNILDFFDGRIAAEIRLPDALERGLLCPFNYYGITDNVSLNQVRWRSGRYDEGELSQLYTQGDGAGHRCQIILEAVERYVPRPETMKALGFCVSRNHARFMADNFNSVGIPSLSLTADSPREERLDARRRLQKGELRCLFTVDLYNEGVDIPEVDTVLFLRPTQSLTIFLQQLGRGLRKTEGKEALTALDFIGQAHQRYDFESKYAALFLNTKRSVADEVRTGFVSLPNGCSIVLEKIAARYILENIRTACSTARGLVARLKNFQEDTGEPLSLKAFLSRCQLDPKRLYRQDTFSRLCVRAGLRGDFPDDLEQDLKRGLALLASADSGRWIRFLLRSLSRLNTILDENLSPDELLMLKMLYVTVFRMPAGDWLDAMRTGFARLARSPHLPEVRELLEWQLDRISLVTEPLNLGFDCPLELHGSYTRDQIFAALDCDRPGDIREGVKWLPGKRTDVLLVTLVKKEKQYSATTCYDDYAINADLFHWQSQSTTPEQSRTGQRYIHHREQGSRVLLFVREDKTDPLTGMAGVYTCLGTVSYESHEGSRPMNIVWRLDRPIPARFLQISQRLKA